MVKVSEWPAAEKTLHSRCRWADECICDDGWIPSTGDRTTFADAAEQARPAFVYLLYLRLSQRVLPSELCSSSSSNGSLHRSIHPSSLPPLAPYGTVKSVHAHVGPRVGPSHPLTTVDNQQQYRTQRTDQVPASPYFVSCRIKPNPRVARKVPSRPSRCCHHHHHHLPRAATLRAKSFHTFIHITHPTTALRRRQISQRTAIQARRLTASLARQLVLSVFLSGASWPRRPCTTAAANYRALGLQ